MTCGLKRCCVLVKHRHKNNIHVLLCYGKSYPCVFFFKENAMKSRSLPLMEINQRWRRTKVVFAVAGFPYVKW